MTDSAGVVFVVDDDASMRESLKNLIRSVGLRVETLPLPRSSCERNKGMSRGASFLMCECLASVDLISRNGWLKRASIFSAPACDPSRFT